MAAGRFDLGEIIKKTIKSHTARKGCPWKDNAAEDIIASKEFKDFADFIETFEMCKEDLPENILPEVSRSSHYS